MYKTGIFNKGGSIFQTTEQKREMSQHKRYSVQDGKEKIWISPFAIYIYYFSTAVLVPQASAGFNSFTTAGGDRRQRDMNSS